jgi:NADPH-dependent 2,4-dienoyl-CoA reductase/sulfur reductase-like enzyme/nitrite reductase/ring-hydroxylating ferredoxin subunit
MGGELEPLTGPDFTKGIRADEIREGELLLGHAEGEPVLLTRCGLDLVAVGARCPHYGAPLVEGLVVGDTIRCPWHHAAFSLRTGETLRPPALGGLPCWNVAEHEGLVTVGGKRAATTVGRRASARLMRPGAPESVLILGGGAAGAMAAETLRREGYDRPITIVESGSSAPYDRPNLSKDYLAGTAPEEWIPLRAPSFYSDHAIDLVLDVRATAIDVAGRQVSFRDGSTRSFGAMLIATGATPVKLAIAEPGQPIHYLRSLDDSRAIIRAASSAKRAVVLGASFIGLEVAAALRARGLEVTVVGPEARPLERVLGAQLGDLIRALHERRGVVFRLGQTASTIGAKDVTLKSGERIAADLVVAGIGVRPNSELAERAGLTIDRGIVVNEHLETSVPGIYAAGDVARWPDARTGELIRVEHWVVAQRQAQTAARNMLAGPTGRRERFEAVPFFWSQHYDVSVSYVGHAALWDSLQIDGDLDAHDCSITYLERGEVAAVATIFRDRESLTAELALERRARAPSVALAALAGRPATTVV